MKMTVLQLVQQIANKLTADEVNSIGDSVESYQIALELESTYYAMLDDIAWPFQYNLVALEGSLDTDRPTHMHVPEAVDNFKWIKYRSADTNPIYNEVQYVTPEEFIELISNQATGNNSTVVQDYSGAYFTIGTDRDPRYYTLFDDEYVVFDSYDSSVDSTLQSSKVIAMGQTIPVFVLQDSFVPDLPAKYFPQLLAEASAACYFYQKQSRSPVDEGRARRSHVRHFNNLNRTQEAVPQTPSFGRS